MLNYHAHCTIAQCPTEHVYSVNELASASYNGNPDAMLVEIRGEVFDLTSFAPIHQPGNAVIPLVCPLAPLYPCMLNDQFPLFSLAYDSKIWRSRRHLHLPCSSQRIVQWC